MKKFIIILCIFVVLGAGGYAVTKVADNSEQNETEEFTIVTSFYPMYIVALNVADGIDGVEVVNLTENHTGCLHDYQMTTTDMRTLENADVFIMNGGGMESFVEDIAKQYPDLTIIDASEGIDLIENEEHEDEHEEEDADHEEDSDEHDHDEEENAHVWLNPVLYKQQIATISEGLCKVDESNADSFEANSTEYNKQIDELIEEYDAVAACADEQIITFHDAFIYLAQFLNMDVVYSVDLDDDTSLSAGDIAEVVDCVNSNGVSVLFTDEEHKDSIASNISGETDASVYVLDALVDGENTKDAYLDGMHANIEVLKEAFSL